MDLMNNLLLGFQTALTFQNLLYCFFGVTVGTLIGVLPGMGPVATVAMLLPITYALDPASALIMLAGIYYGAQYGGSTTAILVNIPGDASAVVTCLDGHKMAKKGRAGAALGIAALGSFCASFDGDRLSVRPRGILQPHGAGVDRCRGARHRVAFESRVHDHHRVAPGPCRHGHQFGRHALHVRL